MVATTARPPTVTALVALTVVAAVLELAVGSLFLAASDTGALGVDEDPARLAGGLLIGFAVAELVLAIALARGSNAARLVLTVVLVLRFGSAWYLVIGEGADIIHGLMSLLLVGVLMFLAWNAKATAYFERAEDRALTGAVSTGLAERGTGYRVLDYVVRLGVLSVTIAATPGIRVDSAASLLLAVLMITLAGWALSPVLVRVTGLFGWVGALALALFANAVFLGVGLALTPGVEVDSVGGVLLASWVYALVMTVVTWAFSVNSQDYLIVHATRMSRRSAAAERSDLPGVLFVQLDGVPAPVLENEVRAGNLPTISRWIRSGSHTWTEWVARVPSTTPVSQAGLLHGSNEDIPAFRWYDRDLGRLLVANRPADAALIEQRLSTGAGLLADDGVSISNLFSGDAQTSLLTMSGLRDRQQGLGPSHSYAAFFTHPAGFFRAVLLTGGEMVKEAFQARRQVRRGVEPRVHRGGAYVALRGVTNVFLRDLNVALVVEAMMAGAKSIYVDFVDYDEIAHHAGVTRPESLASLYGLDEVLSGLEALAASDVTPRPYHVVVVSDHGQSQGATFRQRYGQSLEQLVAAHMSDHGDVQAATAEVEAWGPVNVLLTQLSGQDSVSGRMTRRALADRDQEAPIGPAADAGKDGAQPPLVVIGSGNLGGVWFARYRQRLLLSDIDRLHPGLVQALATHPGIGFVVAMTTAGPVAVGPEGSMDLATGEVTGTDPLAAFPAHTRADFLRVARFPHAPDLYVNSLYDPVLDEVAAFEELVGCHGGVGGWQTRPILVHPAEWTLDEDLLDETGRLQGADVVHRQLVRWLRRLGHRESLPDEAAGGLVPAAQAAERVLP